MKNKIPLRLKVFKFHPYSNGYMYKLWILGRKAKAYSYAPMGYAPDFTNLVKILLKSN